MYFRLPHLQHIFTASILCIGSLSTANVQAQADEPALMPLPAHLEKADGQFVLDGNFDVKLDGYTEPRLVAARQRFLDRLSKETGIPLWRAQQAPKVGLIVTTQGPSAPVQTIGEDESYSLKVTPTDIHLSAKNPLGTLHGLQTVLQLVHVTPQGFAVPAVTIQDEPRFSWRGIMIDSSRHFMPIPVIERNLDGMESVKLNVFHWHLSDNQGFRVESKTFPLLHEKGSNGSYYTQQQIHHIIDYARDRGIRVIPEFDMPCHTTAWFVGYPQLASGPGPYEIETHWGIFDPAMDPSRESTFQFLDRFIGEMTALFPDAYFHIGGDECNGKQWDANPSIQAFMKSHGFKDNATLQSYFSGRVQKLVTAHHKIMEGWDEVLQPDTPKDVVIQSWRGPTALAAAARQGNRALLSTPYYIDLNQPASQHYLADPLGGDAASLDPEQKTRILGGEAAMWSEFVTPETIDSRIWPRTAAIAERFWSPQDVRDVDSMYRRLAVISHRLEYDGLQHEASTPMMLQRMSGETNPEALKVLASVVQPPEGYERESLGSWNSYSPLNHLVDAVPPESDKARQFSDLVKLIIAGTATPEQGQQARSWLTLWRDNDATLQPQLQHSSITAELAPLSHDVSEVAGIGLQALESLQNHKPLDRSAADANLQTLKQAERPKAVLRNMLVSPVELLVKAASGS